MPAINPAEALIFRALETALADLQPGQSLGIALSGGVDSVVLAHFCARYFTKHRFFIVHVCHHIRPSAELVQELSLVRSLGRQLSLPAIIHHLDPQELARLSKSFGIEAAARHLRYEALTSHAERLQLRRVLLAHHGDDNLETQILGFVRGLGPGFTAGIQAQRQIWQRPFIELTKATIVQWARSVDLKYSTDSSNANQDIDRNRIRTQILPVIRSTFPAFDQVRKNASDRAQRDNACLDQLADQARVWQPAKTDSGVVELDCAQFWALHPAIRERVIFRLWDEVFRLNPAYTWSRIAISAYKPLLNQEMVSKNWSVILGDMRWWRQGKKILCGPAIVGTGKNGYLVNLQLGVSKIVPGLGALCLVLSDQKRPAEASVDCWQLQDLSEPITIRPWIDGKHHNPADVLIASAGAWYRVQLDRSGCIERLDKPISAPIASQTYWLWRETGVIPGE